MRMLLLLVVLAGPFAPAEESLDRRGKPLNDPFLFPYPDGPFHDTFSWNPQTETWTLLAESEGKDGKRTYFAEDTVRKR